MLSDPPDGEYVTLVWDQDGEAPAHYVTGHVSHEAFRAVLASLRMPVPPPDAKIEHVFVRNVRADNDWLGNRTYTVRHCAASDRGSMPRTYWEIEPHEGVGA